MLSAQLQYIFSVSRVAHYLKAMMRDKIGSFASAQNVETFLNRWISQYVLLDDNATQEQKAQFRCARHPYKYRRFRASRARIVRSHSCARTFSSTNSRFLCDLSLICPNRQIHKRAKSPGRAAWVGR